MINAWLRDLIEVRKRTHPDEAPGRLRKLAVLVLATGTVSAVLLPVELVVRTSWWGSLIPLSVLVTAAWALVALRRGVSELRVSVTFITIGLMGAVARALVESNGNPVSVFWLALAPLLALGTGGRRAGFITLVITLALMTLVTLSNEYHWVQGATPEPRGLVSKLLSTLGICITAFMFMRSSELEMSATINQLQVARAEAERANRAKSEFLATISHEIRTPLNGVTGMAQVLVGETDPENIRDGIQVIRQSADTLLAVINDVLDLSKIEAGRLELESQPFSPAKEVGVVTSLFQARAADRDTLLELTVRPEVPAWVMGDATRFRQVVMNLVSNAVKFTPSGRVTVTLSRRPGGLGLEVRDTGIGINPEALERLFTPFSQADASTKRRFGGTGLGLAITRKLAEAMGGSISVESQPGRGSVFTVGVRAEETRPAASSPEADLSHRFTVLVVEDNPVNQTVITRLLEKLGHRAVVAHDGQQALDTFPTDTFDVVLMDCHMPVMDGFEATRMLRARGATTPIFALTAATTSEDRQACLDAGMNGVLTKPLRLERLTEVLTGLAPRAQLARVG